jgi:hypothetical protein
MMQKLEDLKTTKKPWVWPYKSTQLATMDDVCSNHDLAFRAWRLVDDFDIMSFVPTPVMESNMFHVSYDPLDRESIMLYGTVLSGGRLWWRNYDTGEEYPIYINHYPSAGDVTGVKVIYPDINPNVAWHPPAPTRVPPSPPEPSSTRVPPQVPSRPARSPPKSRLPPPKPLKPASLHPSGPRQGKPATKSPPVVPPKPASLVAPDPPTMSLIDELDNVGL